MGKVVVASLTIGLLAALFVAESAIAANCVQVGVGYECAGTFVEPPGHPDETCTVTWSDGEADGEFWDDGDEVIHSMNCVPNQNGPGP